LELTESNTNATANKVSFILLGAMKCGTTSIANVLSKHPEIDFCRIKEPHFFSKEYNNDQDFEKYHDLFQNESHKIRGEASNSYTKYPKFGDEVALRIKKYNPKMKFIYVMRNPYEQITSHYKHFLSNQKAEILDINDIIFTNIELIDTCKYYSQLKFYFDLFEENQFLLLTYDELIENEVSFFNKIFEFLGVSQNIEINLSRMNTSDSRRKTQITKKVQFIDSKVFSSIKRLFSESAKQRLRGYIYKYDNKEISNFSIELNEKSKKYIKWSLDYEVSRIEQLINKKTNWL
jgi:hypothetical protein